MRDFKQQQNKKSKVRQNRRKQQQKKPLNLRQLLHRSLRVGVVIFSGTLIVVGSFFVVQLMMASDMFRVEQITAEGGRQLSNEQLVALSDIRPGLNTFGLDLELIGRKIAENPWVREAQVERIFPRRIVIRIVERQPLAIINLGYLYYLDSHGEIFKVLDADDQLDYPVVSGFDYQKLQDRDWQSASDLQRIVGLINDLQQRNGFNLEQVSEIQRLDGGSFDLYTLEGGVKIRLGRKNHRQKLDRLERIYSELQPRLPILDYIDLNVDEKVIVRIERPFKPASG